MLQREGDGAGYTAHWGAGHEGRRREVKREGRGAAGRGESERWGWVGWVGEGG